MGKNISDFLKNETAVDLNISDSDVTTSLFVPDPVSVGDMVVANKYSGTLGTGPDNGDFYSAIDGYYEYDASLATPESKLMAITTKDAVSSSFSTQIRFKVGVYADGSSLWADKYAKPDYPIYKVSSTGKLLKYNTFVDNPSGNSAAGKVVVDTASGITYIARGLSVGNVTIEKLDENLEYVTHTTLDVGGTGIPVMAEGDFVINNDTTLTLFWSYNYVIYTAIINKSDLSINTAAVSFTPAVKGGSTGFYPSTFVSVDGGKIGWFSTYTSTTTYLHFCFVNSTTGLVTFNDSTLSRTTASILPISCNYSSSADVSFGQNSAIRPCPSAIEVCPITGGFVTRCKGLANLTTVISTGVDSAPTYTTLSSTILNPSPATNDFNVYDDVDKDLLYVSYTYYGGGNSHAYINIIDKTTLTRVGFTSLGYIGGSVAIAPTYFLKTESGDVVGYSKDAGYFYTMRFYNASVSLRTNNYLNLGITGSYFLGGAIYGDYVALVTEQELVMVNSAKVALVYTTPITSFFNSFIPYYGQAAQLQIFKADTVSLRASGVIDANELQEWDIRVCPPLVIGAALSASSNGEVLALVNGWTRLNSNYNKTFVLADHLSSGGNIASIMCGNVKLGE